MHEPHKFPRFTIYNLQKDYLPSLHNLTTKYHKHQETTTTHTNHTHHISHYPLHPSHPIFSTKKKSSKILHSIRQGWWRWDTHGAHTIVIHLPTGKRPPNDRTRFCCRRRLCWDFRPLLEGRQLLPGAMREIQEASEICSSWFILSIVTTLIFFVVIMMIVIIKNNNSNNDYNNNHHRHRYTVSYNRMSPFA